jgi:long-chain acyl-CoA synthetase
MIPLYDTLGLENITYCLKHSGITTCFVTPGTLPILNKTPDIGRLTTVVTIGDAKQEDAVELIKKGVTIVTW